MPKQTFFNLPEEKICCIPQEISAGEARRIKEAVETLRTAIDSPEPWLIVSKAPCPLHERKPLGPPLCIDPQTCRKCNLCLKLGCPAIEKRGDAVTINEYLCAGCEMCSGICPAKAIGERR